MLVDFDLTENTWLNKLFDIREKWIPVYNRGTFFAGMNSTQRSESINSFFDGYVNSRTSLREFVESCDQALERMYVRERQEDYKSIHMKRVFISHDLLVKHASEIYTRGVFNKVQEDFTTTLKYRSHILDIDGDEHIYRVCWNVGKSIPVLCYSPPHFIMERWTKRANTSEFFGSDDLVMKDDKIGMEAMRISHYCQLLTELDYMVGKSSKAYKVAMGFLNQAFEKVRKIEMVEVGQEHGKNMKEELCVNVEPLIVDKSSTIIELLANDESCASSPAKKNLGNPRISKLKVGNLIKIRQLLKATPELRVGVDVHGLTFGVLWKEKNASVNGYVLEGFYYQ
ncbi:protein FAR1-RELATED SEQUENCE 5-like [Papaver somniferum]|uniref:protein FAR1-RELATED SEQUENCE 5-like n=1 Tax=Papaver somniferum TaxID=3469 RepID=UPI000E6FAFB0|nr:protein FAR1-RELATED SEQUENCE 5-like [Papaver somniferum]